MINLPEWINSLRALIGPERMSIADGDLRLHSYDAWPIAVKWRQQGKQPYQPDVVVRPVDTVEVSRLLAWASENYIPVTPWGAGSSVTGAPLPLQGGITLDMSAMSRLLALDETNLLVKVEAGMRGEALETELNARGYTLNHSPQSLHRSSVGGWIATRATGQFSSRWGGIEELVVALSIVLPGGEIIETKLAPRAAIGPDLKHIFIGSEGTLGVVTEATLKIFPLTERHIFEAVVFDNVETGLTAMRKMMRVGLRPFLVRFYDEDESRHVMQEGDFTGCVMFLGFEGIPAVAQAEYDAGMGICRAEGGQPAGANAVLAWMERRFDFSVVENILERPGGFAETIETAHMWTGIPTTYRALKEALLPLADEVLGHFSHVYPQGTSLYMILLGEAADAAAAEQRLQQIWELSMRICLEQGAVISHHHGVGLARLPFIRQDLSTGTAVLDRIKQALDPAGIMNPGKLGALPSKGKNGLTHR